MRELRDLSESAEGGDEEARKELRRLVRSSSPVVVGRASDSGRTGGRMAARTAAGGDPLLEEALFARLDALRREIAGENPTPLEVLLTERVVACWMLVELFEVLTAARPAEQGGRAPRADLPHPADGQMAGEREPPLPRRHPGTRPGEEAAGERPEGPIQHADQPRRAGLAAPLSLRFVRFERGSRTISSAIRAICKSWRTWKWMNKTTLGLSL